MSEKPEQASPRPWSVPVAAEDVPETGRRIELAPDDAARAAIAKVAGVAGLPRLSASFDLVRQGRGGLHVTGVVSATVEQTCVVTLDAIRSEIEEPVDLLFTPRHPGGPEQDSRPLAIDAGDPPEVLQDGVVDLGAVATEFLLLGIDPYPRKADAVFDAPPAGDPAPNPFAALAALKRGDSEKDR